MIAPHPVGKHGGATKLDGAGCQTRPIFFSQHLTFHVVLIDQPH